MHGKRSCDYVIDRRIIGDPKPFCGKDYVIEWRCGDGPARRPNSPFTAAMLKFIASPGLDLRLAFGTVRDEVIRTTGNRQEPFVYGSLGGSTVSLVPGSEKPPAESAKPFDESRLELAFWERIKNEKNPQLFQAYLNRYPKGVFADLAKIILQQQKTAALSRRTSSSPMTGLSWPIPRCCGKCGSGSTN